MRAAEKICERRKLWICTGLLVFVLLLNLRYQYSGSENWNTMSSLGVVRNSVNQPLVPEKLESLKHEKWIVVTSIFQPTEQIRKLSQIPGWQLVVVADLKTPLNWTFNNVILLSTDKQKELGYNVLKYLPWNSYTRKVIGYLYAIQHGAQLIYDTDDDNAPNDGSTFENNFVANKTTRGLVAGRSSLVVNPYAHFGQKTVWPRGYPLDQIGQVHNNTYTTCPMHTPIIQQGLVNGDPDVDAIFRLTRRFMQPNIQFDSQAPPLILPRSVLAPYNSQNTIFHYDAFWSLVLPNSVAFRVTDIWRGYWAQPLLWKIGGHLGFYPPHTTQIRNSHVYLKDFGEENQLYKQSGDLVRFLSNWECTGNNLYSCMLELTQAMASISQWASSETDLMKAWISDLRKIGYEEPVFKAQQPCLENQTESIAIFHGVDKAVAEDNKRSALREFCNFTAKTSRPSPKFPTELLIVTFNIPHYENIWLLDLIYRPHYPNILYCGEIQNSSILDNLLASKEFVSAGVKDISFVRTLNIDKGCFLYECALRAIDMNYGVSGYLVVSDDILLNLWNNDKLDHEEMWIQNTIAYRNVNISLDLQPKVANWPWSRNQLPAEKVLPVLCNSTNPLVQEFCTRREELGVNSSLLGFGSSDMFYIPAARKEMYYEVGSMLWKAKVFLELSTPLLSEGISGPNKTVHLNGTALWTGGERSKPFNSFRPSDTFLHPLKLSQVRSSPVFRQEYCVQYIALLLGNQSTSISQ